MALYTLILSTACTVGQLSHDQLVAAAPIDAYNLWARRVRVSELCAKHARPSRAVVACQVRYTDDPKTNLAIELKVQRIRLLDLRQRYTQANVWLRKQEILVKELETALQTMQGDVNEQRIQSELDYIEALAKADVEMAQKEFTEKHPRVALLRGRPKAIQDVTAGK